MKLSLVIVLHLEQQCLHSFGRQSGPSGIWNDFKSNHKISNQIQIKSLFFKSNHYAWFNRDLNQMSYIKSCGVRRLSVRVSICKLLCANRFYYDKNGSIATKLAQDAPQMCLHPGCAQGQGQGQMSRDTGTFVLDLKSLANGRIATKLAHDDLQGAVCITLS